MDWKIVSILLFAVAVGINGHTETSEERLQELCSRYKFLWSDADPSVFYYCFTNKAAVQLKCRTGYYMCKRDGEAFHPCDCQFDGNLDEPSASTSNNAPDGEFPANGCPDPFLRYTDFHRFGGFETDVTSLGQCELTCMQADDCIGVDWIEAEKKCYILPTSAKQYALSQKEGAVHYMRTTCEEPEGPTESATPAEGLSNAGGARFPDVNELPFPVDNSGNNGKQGILFTTPSTAVGGVTVTATPTPSPATAAPAVVTTTTVPDSGCPFSLQKFTAMSHPFGKNITKNGENTDENACKFWCTVRSYCQGVDWDSALGTCYWFQEIQPPLLVSASNVNHYRKTICGRPLMCWSQSGSGNQDALLAVTDTTTAQVQCIGYCFLRQTVSTANPTVERGCLPIADFATAPALGCSIDGTNLLSATCYCDRDRCNGLSLSALSSQILYLPLDGNLLDHSGFNRFAVTATGYSSPTFSCLDRSSNCSALFTGQQCIVVNQMSQTVWGRVDEAGNLTPQLTLSVFFKRLPDGSSIEEGIFGNSINGNVQPSWAIIGQTNENLVRAGIDSTIAPTGLNDFLRAPAPSDSWVGAQLVYDGRSIETLNLPMTRFYLNAVRQTGNEQADTGEVQIRDQPVSIGCVSGLNFTGFIDEVRIFNTVLQPNDITALNIMRDALYW